MSTKVSIISFEGLKGVCDGFYRKVFLPVVENPPIIDHDRSSLQTSEALSFLSVMFYSLSREVSGSKRFFYAQLAVLFITLAMHSSLPQVMFLKKAWLLLFCDTLVKYYCYTSLLQFISAMYVGFTSSFGAKEVLPIKPMQADRVLSQCINREICDQYKRIHQLHERTATEEQCLTL